MPKKRKRQIMRNPNSYGSIKKLSGNRRRPYMACVNPRINDKGSYSYDILGYFEERPDAMIAIAKYNENKYDLTSNNLTFSELYHRWFHQKYETSKKTYSRSSMDCSNGAFQKAEKLHDIKFKEIRPYHMQEILDDYTLSHAYMEHIANLFRQLYKYALALDITQKDYSAFITITKDEDDEPGVPFTPEEVANLWKNKDKPFVDSILIFIYSGWRISELLPMKRDFINLEARTMTGGIKTTAGKNRVVPIHSKIYDMVSVRMNEGYPVLFGLDGKSISSKEKYYPCFAAALQSAGILSVHTPHDCRHTFATLLNNAGANPVSVKRLMGHAGGNDTTEKVYTHKTLDDLRKAIELI